MQVKVSVIIPIYNVKSLLPRCLNSVINQTIRELEIICINDGSTDNSLLILKEYAKKDQRIVIINQENQGQSIARNLGMKNANGEYIGFVDSDDWVDLNFFEQLYNTAKKHDADIACCSIVRKYQSGKMRIKLQIIEEKIYDSTAEKYAITDTPRKCFIWNKIYKKSKLIEYNLNFPEGIYFEDIHFSIRALYFMKKLVTVPKVKYYYWVNKQSTTRIMSDKKQCDILTARKDIINFYQEHNINLEEKNRIIQKHVYKIFGILIMKIYEWKTIKRYYLFGIVPVFEKRRTL